MRSSSLWVRTFVVAGRDSNPMASHEWVCGLALVRTLRCVDMGSAPLGNAFSPLDADLRHRLEEYVHVVRSLTASPLFGRGSVGLHLSLREDGQFDVSAQAPVDWDGLRGALTYFRRMWMNDERTCFARLRNMLRANAVARGGQDAATLTAWLDALGEEHSRVRKELPDMAVLEGHIEDGKLVEDGAVTPERIIDDWFNGEIFHGDPEPRGRLDAAGDAEAYVLGLMVAVQEVTRVYVLLARLARAILAEPALHPGGA